jgi:hypothetical protein
MVFIKPKDVTNVGCVNDMKFEVYGPDYYWRANE